MSLTLPQGACFVRTLTALPPRLKGGAVAIGNFDGVHRGHQAVIDAARAVAKAQSIPLLCLTFEPHPRTVFARCRGEDEPFRLTPGAEKILALAGLDLDGIVSLRFTPEFARQSPDGFIRDILIEGLAARHIAIGVDFRFGCDRSGNAERLSAETAFTVTALQPHREQGGDAFAATLIRQHLRRGEPEIAAKLMGRPFTLTGRVRHGDQRGRRLGFPTANLALGDYLRPAFGAYAVTIALDGRLYRGVANLGRRPSVAEAGECLEVHLFDFSGDLYGQKIRVALRHFLRPERKFDDLDALTQQIARDVARARDKLGSFC